MSHSEKLSPNPRYRAGNVLNYLWDWFKINVNRDRLNECHEFLCCIAFITICFEWLCYCLAIFSYWNCRVIMNTIGHAWAVNLRMGGVNLKMTNGLGGILRSLEELKASIINLYFVSFVRKVSFWRNLFEKYFSNKITIKNCVWNCDFYLITTNRTEFISYIKNINRQLRLCCVLFSYKRFYIPYYYPTHLKSKTNHTNFIIINDRL